ncbi:hypothetical protein BGZ99_004750 [Dissophora globulifera]|uniref:Uncharacterized protein n=1 Tax=Dissophora globulifera TaxID=979702 RepID=A0A9P6V106_9FUNG|nr:hypothetical protein BGZ99_004750 [Dissophora globulifera]
MKFLTTSLAGAVALVALSASQWPTTHAETPLSWLKKKSHQPAQARAYGDDGDAYKSADDWNNMAPAHEIFHASVARATGPTTPTAVLDEANAACPTDVFQGSVCFSNSQQPHSTPPSHIKHEASIGHGTYPSLLHPHHTPTATSPLLTETASATEIDADSKETLATMLTTPRSADEPHFRFGVVDQLHKRFEQVIQAISPSSDNDDFIVSDEEDEEILEEEDEIYIESLGEQPLILNPKIGRSASKRNIARRGDIVSDDAVYGQDGKGGHSQHHSTGKPSWLSSLVSGKENEDTTAGDSGAGSDATHAGTSSGKATAYSHQKRGDAAEVDDRSQDSEPTLSILPVLEKLKRGLPKVWDIGHLGHRDSETGSTINKKDYAHGAVVEDEGEVLPIRITSNDEAHAHDSETVEDHHPGLLTRVLSSFSHKIHTDASSHLEQIKSKAHRPAVEKEHHAFESLKYQMSADKLAHVKADLQKKREDARAWQEEQAALKKREERENAMVRAAVKKHAKEEAKRLAAEQKAATKAEALLRNQQAKFLAQQKKEAEKREAAQKEAAKKLAKQEAALLKKRQDEQAEIDRQAAIKKKALEAQIAAEAKAHQARLEAENKKHEQAIKAAKDKILAEEKQAEAKKLAAEKVSIAKLKKQRDEEERISRKEAKKNKAEAKKRQHEIEKRETELQKARLAKIEAELLAQQAWQNAERV